MKNLSIIIVFMLLLFGCSKTNPEAEKANAEATLKGFYQAAEKFDEATMRTFCAQDFHGIENGHSYNNLDEFIEMAKSLEGSTGQVNMDFIKTEVSGGFAFLIVKFDAVWTKGPSKFYFKTVENYILKKIDGKWLISFWQSTYLPDEHDKKFTTIHCMKVTEKLPIADINEFIKKANEIVAALGYPECGYTLLKVVADKGVQYNWIMMGSWKNADVYKIIHESKEITGFFEQNSKAIQPYFKDEIYLKASLE